MTMTLHSFGIMEEFRGMQIIISPLLKRPVMVSAAGAADWAQGDGTYVRQNNMPGNI